MNLMSNSMIYNYHEQNVSLTVLGNSNTINISNCQGRINVMGNGNVFNMTQTNIQVNMNGNNNIINLEETHFKVGLCGNYNKINICRHNNNGQDSQVQVMYNTGNYNIFPNRATNLSRRSGRTNRNINHNNNHYFNFNSHNINNEQYQQQDQMDNFHNNNNNYHQFQIWSPSNQHHSYPQFNQFTMMNMNQQLHRSLSEMLNNLPFSPNNMNNDNDEIIWIGQNNQHHENNSNHNHYYFNNNQINEQLPRSSRRQQGTRYNFNNPFRNNQESVRGLAPAQLKVLPSSKHQGEATKCTICLQNIKQGNKVTYLFCFHFFHTQCAKSWLKKSAACPLCKLNVIEHLHAEH